MKLSEQLTQWRAERPDEWTMDRFIREAQRLEKALEDIAIDHREPKDHGWYSQCNGCQANIDKEPHEDDCPFVLAGIVSLDKG